MPSPARSQAVNRPLKRIVHPSKRSVLRLVWLELLTLIFGFILLIPTWVFILLFLPISLFAGWCIDIFILVFYRKIYPGFQRVAPWDAVWLGKADPKTPPLTTALITVQQGMTFQEVKALVLDRMVLAKDDSDNIMYPRFMQKIVKVCGSYAWVFQKEFDPAKHVVLIPNHVNSLELLRLYVTDLALTALPFDRPLWTLHICTDFGPDRDIIVVFRYHQAMSDGISLVKILCRSVTDKTQDIYHIKSRFGGINFFINTVRSIVMASVFFVSKMLFHSKSDWKKSYNPFHGVSVSPRPQKKKVAAASPQKTELFWAESIPLGLVERITMVTRNSMHNVLLTCLSGAMRSCLTADGMQRVSSIRACIPVDLRRPLASVTNPIQMGNQFVLLNTKLPTDTIGLIPRLWKIRQEEDVMKNSSNTTSVYWIIQILGHLLPAKMLSNLLARSIISCCTIANVPGPDAQLYLEEKPIKSLFFWPPTICSRNVLSISFFTYAERLYMGVAADPDVCDTRVLAAEFAQQVRDLSDLLSNRRAPGETKQRRSETHEPLPALRTRILDVQRALVEAQIAAQSVNKDPSTWGDHVAKVELLKEELMEILSVARRRKSVAEGVSMDFEASYHELPVRRMPLECFSDDPRNTEEHVAFNHFNEMACILCSEMKMATLFSGPVNSKYTAIQIYLFSAGKPKSFQEDEDMVNEVRSGLTSPRRRSSSVSSVESVRVFAITPTRLSGSAETRESISTSATRSRTYSNMSQSSQARSQANKKLPHTHVIHVTRDVESHDSTTS